MRRSISMQPLPAPSTLLRATASSRLKRQAKEAADCRGLGRRAAETIGQPSRPETLDYRKQGYSYERMLATVPNSAGVNSLLDGPSASPSMLRTRGHCSRNDKMATARGGCRAETP